MEKNTKPGEKVFPVLLLIVGILVTKESWGMYKRSPELSGYGTVPLFCGAMITLLSIVIIITNMFHKSDISGMSLKEKAAAVVKHLFSLDVLVMLVMIIAYCVLLANGIPFIISSPIFLWASMTYLERGNFVKNILFTAIVMAFVILVFKVGFHVVLP